MRMRVRVRVGVGKFEEGSEGLERGPAIDGIGASEQPRDQHSVLRRSDRESKYKDWSGRLERPEQPSRCPLLFVIFATRKPI